MEMQSCTGIACGACLRIRQILNYMKRGLGVERFNICVLVKQLVRVKKFFLILNILEELLSEEQEPKGSIYVSLASLP